MILIALAWPARQMLIAIGRPYRLFFATLAALGITAAAGIIGADRAGIVGVAWGMTVGYSTVFLLTSAAALCPLLGLADWMRHMGRLVAILTGFSVATLLSAHVPTGLDAFWGDLALRSLILSAWLAPVLAFWAWAHGWGGLAIDRFALRNTHR
jgi:hypothetical protein